MCQNEDYQLPFNLSRNQIDRIHSDHRYESTVGDIYAELEQPHHEAKQILTNNCISTPLTTSSVLHNEYMTPSLGALCSTPVITKRSTSFTYPSEYSVNNHIPESFPQHLDKLTISFDIIKQKPYKE